MNKTILLLSIFISSFVFAQEAEQNSQETPEQSSVATPKEANSADKTVAEQPPDTYNDVVRKKDQLKTPPLEYKELRERDVLWSTIVWEEIDLSQKFNLPLYFPIDTLNPNRLSLFEVILRGIRNGAITEVFEDDYFLEKVDLSKLDERLVVIDTTAKGFEQMNAGELIDPSYININVIASNNIAKYYIKGEWYFDRIMGEMRYRMLGICPVGKSASELEKNDTPYPLFWVWVPSAREIFQNNRVYTGDNYSRRISFDQILLSRKFQSIIYKEDNQYMDRSINQYIKQNAFYQLLESDRIKQSIRNFELDLWEN